MLILKRESDRLKTFKNLTLDDKKSYKLARSGFFYTNLKDIVKCYFCCMEMNALNTPEDVEAEHLRRSPSCIYANGKDVCGPYHSRPSPSKYTSWGLNTFKVLAGSFILFGLCCEIYYFYEQFTRRV